MTSHGTFDAVSPGFLIDIDKDTGCCMASTGGRPEMGNCYLYHDRRHHFFFYAVRRWHGTNAYDVTVNGASTQRFAGAIPYVPAEDMQAIQRNIAKFFEERDFSASMFVRPSNEVFHDISFAWSFPERATS